MNICGYGVLFNELATDGRAEFCTQNTFRQFLAKPHRVPLTLGHDGPILVNAIELHANSCGLSFRAEITKAAWAILGPKMLSQGFTKVSLGFADLGESNAPGAGATSSSW